MSVREALKHAALANDVEVEIGWVHAADLEKDKGWDVVQNADGILVPGGFGSRGIEGKILAARYAREKKVPYLGLCLGMQVMCIDFARGVLNHEDANSSEFDRGSEYPVIDLMLDQRSITDMGGTMRLGLYPCELQEGSKAAIAYGEKKWRNVTVTASSSITITKRILKKAGWSLACRPTGNSWRSLRSKIIPSWWRVSSTLSFCRAR